MYPPDQSLPPPPGKGGPRPKTPDPGPGPPIKLFLHTFLKLFLPLLRFIALSVADKKKPLVQCKKIGPSDFFSLAMLIQIKSLTPRFFLLNSFYFKQGNLPIKWDSPWASGITAITCPESIWHNCRHLRGCFAQIKIFSTSPEDMGKRNTVLSTKDLPRMVSIWDCN